MNDQIIALLIAVLSGGFLTALVQAFFYRRKLGADYADVIARSATGLLKPLADRVEELQVDLDRERGRVRQLLRDLDSAYDALGKARGELHALRTELAETRAENT